MDELKQLEEVKIASEEIFDGHVVHLFKDTVRLPNGNSAPRETVRHVGAVAVVPLLDDGRVIATHAHLVSLAMLDTYYAVDLQNVLYRSPS